MPESYVQVPTDSTGKKLRTRQRTVGANTVEEQYMALAADATYWVWTGSLACAANKFFLSILNTGAQVLKVKKLFLSNSALTALTGVGLEFQLQRITSITGGTAVTPNPVDTVDGALSGVTCVHTATSVGGGTPVMFSWYTNNDEIGATNAFPTATLQASISLLPEGPEIKELTLNQNEGFTFKQITSSAVGSFGVLAVITKVA